MISAEFPIIIDLHLNPNTARNDTFYFLCSVQAPLNTGEVPRLAVAMLNLEGRRDACDKQPQTSTSPLISRQTNNLVFTLGLCDSKAEARKEQGSKSTQTNKPVKPAQMRPVLATSQTKCEDTGSWLGGLTRIAGPGRRMSTFSPLVLAQVHSSSQLQMFEGAEGGKGVKAKGALKEMEKQLERPVETLGAAPLIKRVSAVRQKTWGGRSVEPALSNFGS